jgi:ABC-2 type transport system permease protein
VQIEVYANPSRPTGAGIVKAIVDEFVSRVEEGRTSGMTSIVGLMQSGLLNPQNAETEARALFENVEETESTAITLKTDKEGAAATEFDLLAYFAPGMALMFLMYTVSYGGRSILAERAQGHSAAPDDLTDITLRRSWAARCWASSSWASRRSVF